MIMSTLRLPRLLSDGAVIQRRKSIHIWGWDEPGTKVTATLEKDQVRSQMIGMGLIIALMLLAIGNDIFRFVIK